MKVLHLLSNWKWTERAEPAADLAVALQARGVEVRFACGQPLGELDEHAAAQATAKGLDCVTLRGMQKHFNILRVSRDRKELSDLIAQFDPDIVHCHMPHAHLLAALARGNGARPAIVRSCYDPDGPDGGIRSWWLYGHRTDGVVTIGRRAEEVVRERYGLAAERVVRAEPGVDLERFSPDRPIQAGRQDFGLGADDFVVGVVSRIRASRRLDIAMGAVARLAADYPKIRLLVVGRGGRDAVAEVIDAPAWRLKIADKVTAAGYCTGDRLVAAYRSMDALVYPMPGTDTSCRTVREAMAAGVPVVGVRVGFVADLIEDGVTGRLTDISSDSVADAIAGMIDNKEALRIMGRQALATARKRFATSIQAEKVLSLYEHVLHDREGNGRTTVRENDAARDTVAANEAGSILFLDKVFLSPYRKQPRGVELFNLNLIRELARRGFSVSTPSETSWHETITQWLGPDSTRATLPAGSSDSFVASLSLAWRLRKRRFSVLLLANVANRLVPLLCLLRLFHVASRCVLIAHREPSRRSLYTQKLWPTTVLAVNRKIAGHFERSGFDPVAVWYGVMNAGEFHPGPRDERKDGVDFCVLGHLDSGWKGSDTAMAAFRALPEGTRRRCRLHLAAFHDVPKIEDADIIAYAWMDPGKLPDLLRKMDVMVVPSRDEEVMRETFSQAMVQGMLSGLPVIANDLPVLTEKLDQGGGLVVRSVKELSEAMDKLAGDPGLRRRLGEEARRTALARYVWDTEAFVDKFLFPGNRGTYFSHGEARTKD